MAQVTTLSSLGTSTPAMLNPISKSTTVQLTVASGATSTNVLVQYTLDDGTPGTTTTWAALSSAITSSGADIAGGVTYTMLSPIGGLRISSSVTVTGTITLKALQSITA